jgi:hypothetical protein
MIERAVFSYFNPGESFTNKAGFHFYSDFLYTMALATEYATHHFPVVQIITSTWGEKVLRGAGVPATEYSSGLDCMKSVSPWFWAYGKLIAYNMQTTPFVHIDNDVFMWKPLPTRIRGAELCFQSKEYMNIPSYQWYDVLTPCWNTAPVRPEIIVRNPIRDFVYNCGICGGHNLEFFKEWIKCSAEYIFAPENQPVFFGQFKNVLMHQNLFHEQYFAACLIKAHNMRGRVQVITDNVQNLVRDTNRGYSHMWGVTKTDQRVIAKVKARLKAEFPQLYNQVTDFTNSYLFNECHEEEIKALV